MTVFLLSYALIGVIVATAAIYACGIPHGRKSLGAKLVLMIAVPALWLVFAALWPIGSALYIGARVK